MEQHHIEWARQHDWYLSHYRDACSNALAVQVRDDVIPTKVRVFHSYSALRAWAGY